VTALSPLRLSSRRRIRTSCQPPFTFAAVFPNPRAAGYFQMFDVFVSAFGASGLAILEAMAHAKVVLITPEARSRRLS